MNKIDICLLAQTSFTKEDDMFAQTMLHNAYQNGQ